MPKFVAAESVTVETSVPANSRKREVTATIVAGTVSVVLGVVATGLINRVSETVKHRIAPQPKTETEDE